jgi:hypothetical protein
LFLEIAHSAEWARQFTEWGFSIWEIGWGPTQSKSSRHLKMNAGPIWELDRARSPEWNRFYRCDEAEPKQRAGVIRYVEPKITNSFRAKPSTEQRQQEPRQDKHRRNKRKIQEDATSHEHAITSEDDLQTPLTGKVLQEMEIKIHSDCMALAIVGVITMVLRRLRAAASGRHTSYVKDSLLRVRSDRGISVSLLA